MGVSEVTVKVHRHNLMTKMGAKSIPELVRIANILRPDRGPQNKDIRERQHQNSLPRFGAMLSKSNEIGDPQSSLKKIECSHPGSPKPT
jgi:hypothetical protein